MRSATVRTQRCAADLTEASRFSNQARGDSSCPPGWMPADMPAALSLDLQVRVLAAVAGGLSHRAAAERFGVSAASVSRWRALEREQGEARARSQGGDRRSAWVEAHRDLILSMIEETPDMAIEELRQARRRA